MRFNPTLAATLLVLGLVTPAYAETETLPEAALAAERAYVASASACGAATLPPINPVYFPMQAPLSDHTQPTDEPAAATPPTQQPVAACP